MIKIKDVRWFIIAFAILFTLEGCNVQNLQGGVSQAKNLDPYSWDFGQVKEGGILKHNFILRNKSDEILNIKDVTTSCGCTVSKVKKKILSPNESTVIEVRFNSKGYSGAVQQYIYVYTDSVDNPVIRFIMKAEVIKSK